ncbi:MAG: enoyl-CoA hydratase/isomerase family protein [Rubrivivax sp.]|nr:enoyl-CoA hydratase/isomerase family protein [Rubrivivax sp.]
MSVEYRLLGPVAWLRLNRPQALNALDRTLLEALAAAVAKAQADEAVRVLVLTGTGRAFCAGGDIKALLHGVVGGGGASDAGDEDYIDVVARCFRAVRALRKPLIGCVNGVAVGGGLELLLCCDLVVAASTATIGDGHANFGIFPGGGSAVLLPRRLPLNVAKQLLFNGELLPAAHWQAWGLVNQVVEPTQLRAATLALAESLARKSPLLLERMKRVADGSADKHLADALREELFELRAQDAGCTVADVRAAFYGNCAQGYLQGQHLVKAQVALLPLGLKGIPMVNVENACATASTALHMVTTTCARAPATWPWSWNSVAALSRRLAAPRPARTARSWTSTRPFPASTSAALASASASWPSSQRKTAGAPGTTSARSSARP